MGETDLISRQDAIDALGEEPAVWCDSEAEIAERNQWRLDVSAIKAIPSADVRENRTGKWIYKEEELETCLICWQECSECGRKPLLDRWTHDENLSDFCPSCGADMRGEQDATD